MRNAPRYTRARATIAAITLALSLPVVVRAAPPPPTASAESNLAEARTAIAAGRYEHAEDVLQPALSRFPEDPELRLAWIDLALAQGRPAAALERLNTAGVTGRERPDFQLRAAQAHFQAGRVLGEAEVRAVPGGRAGQFAGPWLLVEPRPGSEQFLCCPQDSALSRLRQALDAGLDVPVAHVLHARIWQRLGRPEVGLALLESRAAILLANPDDMVLDTLSELALQAGALSKYLRYQHLRANRHPERHEAILFQVCLAVAGRYNESGDGALQLEWLRRATRLRPDDSTVLLQLANAEWAAGQHREAATHYRYVLEREPKHAERRRIIERLAEAGDLIVP